MTGLQKAVKFLKEWESILFQFDDIQGKREALFDELKLFLNLHPQYGNMDGIKNDLLKKIGEEYSKESDV